MATETLNTSDNGVTMEDLKAGYDKIATTLSRLESKVTDKFSEIRDTVKNNAPGIIEKVRGFGATLWDTTKMAAKDLVKGCTDAMVYVVNFMIDTTKTILKETPRGFSWMLGAVGCAALFQYGPTVVLTAAGTFVLHTLYPIAMLSTAVVFGIVGCLVLANATWDYCTATR